MYSETHHLKKSILLRISTPPSRSTSRLAITAIAEDIHNEATLLHLYNQQSESVAAAKDILIEGAVVLVKEPYFTCDRAEGYVLRVDHVSDLVVLMPGDERIPGVWRGAEGQKGVQELLGEVRVFVGKGEFGMGLRL